MSVEIKKRTSRIENDEYEKNLVHFILYFEHPDSYCQQNLVSQNFRETCL